MTERDILKRYRYLRELSRQHHNAAMKFLSAGAILQQARALRLAEGRTIVCDSDSELTLVFDLAVYSPGNARSRAIDRYRKAAQLPANSEAAMLLDAMCRARFSIWRIERRHKILGVIASDLLCENEIWLIDEGLEQTMKDGESLAMRLYEPEGFAMTCGVAIPVNRPLMEHALDQLRRRPLAEPSELAADPKFAMAVYRAALAHGVMQNVYFV